MKCLVALPLALALVLPCASFGAAPSSTPRAEATALYLTFSEARREIRARLRKDHRSADDYNVYIELGDCGRYSNRRIRCWTYDEYTTSEGYDIECEGPMQVIEFPGFYRTQGKGIDC